MKPFALAGNAPFAALQTKGTNRQKSIRKRPISLVITRKIGLFLWSEWRDSNSRPLEPHESSTRGKSSYYLIFLNVGKLPKLPLSVAILPKKSRSSARSALQIPKRLGLSVRRFVIGSPQDVKRTAQNRRDVDAADFRGVFDDRDTFRRDEPEADSARDCRERHARV